MNEEVVVCENLGDSNPSFAGLSQAAPITGALQAMTHSLRLEVLHRLLRSYIGPACMWKAISF